jgi:hypothetical protein
MRTPEPEDVRQIEKPQTLIRGEVGENGAVPVQFVSSSYRCLSRHK